MEKSIKEISLEIAKLNEELKGLESFLENAIISAIDEYVKRQKIIRINEYCFAIPLFDWVESAKIIKKFLHNKPVSQWVESLNRKLQESQNDKVVEMYMLAPGEQLSDLSESEKEQAFNSQDECYWTQWESIIKDEYL